MESNYVKRKKTTYYGKLKAPCQKYAFNCRSPWAKGKEMRGTLQQHSAKQPT